MIDINGYKIVEKLYENSGKSVYKAKKDSNNSDVILKVSELGSLQDTAQFENEQLKLSMLNHSNIVKLVETLRTPKNSIHIFEDINGITLEKLLFEKYNFTLRDILNIALDVIKALKYIHSKNLVHMDVNLSNIIYNTKSKKIQIIDFEFSKMEDEIFNELQIQDISSSNLVFIAPEQIGITKDSIDYRSDIYGFGMSLYYLLLGKTAEDFLDRFEQIHKQVAYSIKSLHILDKSMPLVISNMVEKLTQKRKENRYQSFEAIIYDLNKCVSNLDTKERVEDFIIAEKDIPLFQVGTDIFGRDNELKVLKSVSQNLNLSKLEHILISGHSGVGKTRLIEEFISFVDQNNIYIFQGKFEQNKSSIPYIGFTQIFSQMITKLLSLDDYSFLESMSEKHKDVLIDIFPEFRKLFKDRKSHFVYIEHNMLVSALKELFNILSSHIKGMLFFIDDLQWIDYSSIELLEQIILESNNQNVSFVISYRDNEIKQNTKAYKLVQRLKKNEIVEVRLKELERDTLQYMFSKMFLNKEDLKDFADIVYLKTNGNPFYIKAYINHLLELKELYFEEYQWKYSIEKIKQHSSSLNIAKILKDKVDTLAAQEKSCLQYLSVLGSSYDIYITNQVMSSIGFSKSLLYKLSHKGFILVTMNKYSFMHDLIQDHTYKSIDEKLLKKINLDIGSFFKKEYKNGEYNDIVSVCNYLNSGYETGSLPKSLFALNLEALHSLIKSNSYDEAIKKTEFITKYFLNIYSFSNKSIFEFNVLKIKSFYLSGDLELAYTEILLLISKTKKIQNKLICFTILKNICVTLGEHFSKVIDFSNELFNDLNMNISFKVDDIGAVNKKIEDSIKQNPLLERASNISALKILDNEKEKSLMALFVDFWEIAYYLADLPLMKWAYLNIINHSFKYGNCSASTFGYVLYGAELVSNHKYREGKVFGDVALKLNYKFKDEVMLPKVHNFVANFINPYTNSLESNIDIYSKSLRQSKKNGDIVFGTWANFLMHFSSFLSGEKLEKVYENIMQESDFILASGDAKMIYIFNFLKETIDSLQNDKQTLSEKSMLNLFSNESFYPGLTWYAIIKAQNYYMRGMYTEGLDVLDKYVKSEDNMVIMFPKIRLHFIRALLLCANKDSLSQAQKKTLEEDTQELYFLHKSSPKYFKFEKMLISVENQENKTSPWHKAKLYDSVLEYAYSMNNKFYIAIVTLCISRFWNSFGNKEMKEVYNKKVIVELEKWGAIQLSNKYKNIEKNNASEDVNSHMNSANYQSLLGSFNAISKLTSKRQLLTILMKTITQNATASRAVIILKQKNIFYVKASSDFQSGSIEFNKVPLSQSSIVPVNLINYTLNSQNYIQLENPLSDGDFQSDPYFKSFQPTSCTVIPSIVESETESILYLENKEVSVYMSSETINTLKLLLTQASIVFKNIEQIDEINRSKEELEYVKNQYELAINGTEDGLWDWNLETNELYFSSPWKKMIGYEDKELKNELSTWEKRVHPDDLKTTYSDVQSAISSSEGLYNNTHRLRHKNGSWVWILARGKVIFDKENIAKRIIGFHTDISKQKELESKLNLSILEKNKRMQEIQCLYDVSKSTQLEASVVHMIYNTIEFIAQGWKHTDETSVRITFDDRSYLSSRFEDSEFKQFEEIVVNKQVRGKIEVIYADDYPFISEEKSLLVNISQMIGVSVERIESSEAVKFQEELIVAQSRHVAMGEMIGMIAHQWRQPITVISMGANNMLIDIELEDIDIDNFKKESLSILKQTEYLSKTIEDFRNFFRPDKKREFVKISDIFNDALSIIGATLSNNKIDVVKNMSDRVEVQTYSRELLQVFINLLKNAKEALVEHTKSDRKIEITIFEENEYVKITVCDNGGGISDDVISKIFDPYFTTKGSSIGTGLGLHMSKTIIEQHLYGRIVAQSFNNKACFNLDIPKDWKGK